MHPRTVWDGRGLRVRAAGTETLAACMRLPRPELADPMRACSPPRAGRESHRSGAAGGLSRDRRSGQVSGGRVVLVLGDTCGTKQIRGRHLGAWLGCLPAGRPVAFAPPCVCVCLSVSLLLLVCSSAVQDDEEGHAIN